uniref:UDP-N-acetylglucosamine transferase subunit ALG14 n=2 Tax=Parascaris univalens TaxID=6257 RepID=A0A915B3X9_PARUN
MVMRLICSIQSLFVGDVRFFFFFSMIAILFYLLSALVIIVAVLEVLYLRRHSRIASTRTSSSSASVRVSIVIGSGGHTTEMLPLVGALGTHYKHRTYIIAETDLLSEKKVLDVESSRVDGSFTVVRIGRSREVLQSYFTAILSTLRALMHSFAVVWKERPDVLLCNGPGTCIPVCFAAAMFDLLRLRDTRIFFIESICRVKSLSLSALILYYLRIPDSIIVQWRDL